MIQLKKYLLAAIVITSLIGLVVSCKKGTVQTLKLATTTSTDNTGLLDYLKPSIKEDTGIDLQWVAVGTGRALALGKNCDVDVLMVHAPAAEKKYLNDGYGINRLKIMYNDFIIIGPKSDQAGIRGKSLKKAFRALSLKKASFISRGDDSGTHKKEISLWKVSGLPVPDREEWYIQTGQGMINTINIATERQAYTITDRATYILYKSKMKEDSLLVILIEGDSSLRNQYSVIAVNPDRCSNVKYTLSKKFILWITSSKAQRLIADFKLMGKKLYIPNAEIK